MKMKKSLRLLAVLGVMSLSVFGFTACGDDQNATGDKASEVRIGTMNLVNGDLIAQQEQWYENELGVKVRMMKFSSGPDMNKAIADNVIDIAQSGTAPAASAIAEGQDLEVIFIGNLLGSAETLIAKPNSGITSLQDLPGKRVAVTFLSTAHYSLVSALKQEGINPNSIQFFYLKPDEILPAWQRNDIDAAYIWYPMLDTMYEEGGISITDSGQLAKHDIVTADLAVTSKKFAEQNPELMTKFVELQMRANDMIKNDPDHAAQDVADILGISVEDAQGQFSHYGYLDADEQIEQLDNHMPQVLKNTADFFVDQKAIPFAPDLDMFQQHVTSEYVKNALKNTKSAQ